MSVPPKLVRRLAIAPLVIAFEALLVAATPLLLVVALLTSPLTGTRAARAVVLVAAGAALHATAIIACFGLWVASGFGARMRTARVQEAHYDLMRWFVTGLYDVIVAVAKVRVVAVESDEAGALLGAHDRPVLLFGRHAGEGDTLLVLYELLVPHQRHPRIVMHERLRLDPLVDVLGERLPNRFVDPRGGDTEREIHAMAETLDDDSALLIFPEGRNFSDAHRQRAIDRLHEAGRAEQAALAERMTRVSAPRPGGALAAIEAAPHADVVVMGHVGFPDGVKDVWHQLPKEQVVTVRLWREPAESIPATQQERIAWLFERWRVLDEWVVQREREGATSG